MKNLFLLVFALFSFTMVAQESFPQYQPYASIALSTRGQGDFQSNSYASVEVGVTHKQISYGVAIGRSNLVDVFQNDQLANYYWEVKFSPSYNLGSNFSVNLIAGGGAYFNSDNYFAEIGAGLGYSVNNFTYGVSYSNWDELNYFSPYISYSF